MNIYVLFGEHVNNESNLMQNCNAVFLVKPNCPNIYEFACIIVCTFGHLL